MKVFLDTNIFTEYIEERQEVESVAKILDAVADGRHQGLLSQGAFYTLAFLLEKTLKRKDVHRPLLTEWLRRLLEDILATAIVVGVSHERLKYAVADEAFDDLEDSFQYQCALENGCEIFVTINIRDYKNVASSDMEIITPADFVEKYL